VAGLYGAMAVAGKPPSGACLACPPCLHCRACLACLLTWLTVCLPCLAVKLPLLHNCLASLVAIYLLPACPSAPAALADQRFVVLGAGSAGMGVVSMIAASESGRRPAGLPCCMAVGGSCKPHMCTAFHLVTLPLIPQHSSQLIHPFPSCPRRHGQAGAVACRSGGALLCAGSQWAHHSPGKAISHSLLFCAVLCCAALSVCWIIRGSSGTRHGLPNVGAQTGCRLPV
jgi:hypothetical protein